MILMKLMNKNKERLIFFLVNSGIKFRYLKFDPALQANQPGTDTIF
jgi:hypothetical protein